MIYSNNFVSHLSTGNRRLSDTVDIKSAPVMTRVLIDIVYNLRFYNSMNE